VQGENAQDFWKPTIKKITTDITSNYIGCDEVGVGDYFGGMVTCAVYLQHQNEESLKAIGITDSKDLSDREMFRIYPQLIKLVKYTYLSYLPDQYNKLVDQYKNTHIIKALMHDLTIKALVQNYKIANDTSVILDQFTPPNKYFQYFDVIKAKPYPISHFMTGAEKKNLAVAAASIIARIKFLEQISNLQKLTNVPILLGASNPKIITYAQQIYQHGGTDELKQFVKIHFATTKKVLS
jgi:ribonuclease HIII